MSWVGAMPDHPTNYSDAELIQTFPLGSENKCFLWKRSEVADSRSGITFAESWYELTFGDSIPSRSSYLEDLELTDLDSEEANLGSQALHQVDAKLGVISAFEWIANHPLNFLHPPIGDSRKAELRPQDLGVLSLEEQARVNLPAEQLEVVHEGEPIEMPWQRPDSELAHEVTFTEGRNCYVWKCWEHKTLNEHGELGAYCWYELTYGYKPFESIYSEFASELSERFSDKILELGATESNRWIRRHSTPALYPIQQHQNREHATLNRAEDISHIRKDPEYVIKHMTIDGKWVDVAGDVNRNEAIRKSIEYVLAQTIATGEVPLMHVAYGGGTPEEMVEGKELLKHIELDALGPKERAAFSILETHRGEIEQGDGPTSEKTFFLNLALDSDNHISILSYETEQRCLSYGAQLYAAHTLEFDREPALYLSEEPEGRGVLIPRDILLENLRHLPLSEDMERLLSVTLADRSEEHKFHATTLDSAIEDSRLSPTDENYDVGAQHTIEVNRDLLCLIDRHDVPEVKPAYVVSFFNPREGYPEAVNGGHPDVKKAIELAERWIGSDAAQEVLAGPPDATYETTREHVDDSRTHDAQVPPESTHSPTLWPILRPEQDAEPSLSNPLVGYISSDKLEEAQQILPEALGYEEHAQAFPEPEHYQAITDRVQPYVLWTVNEQGLATSYTSAEDLLSVTDVHERYLDNWSKVEHEEGVSCPALVITQWDFARGRPTEIQLEEVQDQHEHKEFDESVLGRHVPESEIEAARERTRPLEERLGSFQQTQEPGQVTYRFAVWEQNENGTVTCRSHSADYDDIKSQAVDYALEERRVGRPLPSLLLTELRTDKEPPSQEITMENLSEISRPLNFDLDQEIEAQHPVAEFSRPEPRDAPPYRYVRLQADREVKPGDYLAVERVGSEREEVGFFRVDGVSDRELLRIESKWALLNAETNQVHSVHDEFDVAKVTLDSLNDAYHQEINELRNQELPGIPHREQELPRDYEPIDQVRMFPLKSIEEIKPGDYLVTSRTGPGGIEVAHERSGPTLAGKLLNTRFVLLTPTNQVVARGFDVEELERIKEACNREELSPDSVMYPERTVDPADYTYDQLHGEVKTATVYREVEDGKWQEISTLEVTGFEEVLDLAVIENPAIDHRVLNCSEQTLLDQGDVIVIDEESWQLGENVSLEPTPAGFLEWQKQREHDYDHEI